MVSEYPSCLSHWQSRAKGELNTSVFFRNKFRVGGKLLEKKKGKVNQDLAKLGLGGGLGSV